MERSYCSCFMAIDLSAAFDTVNHEILINFLEYKFGIKGSVLAWFDMYLRPRSLRVCVCVCVGDAYSTERGPYFSVPQGSCCGPILYLAYTIGMEEVVQPHSGVDIHGYTDDHGVKKEFDVHHIDNILEINAISRVETCATKIKKWMDQMGLKMNDDKTEFIIFGSKRQLPKTITKHVTFNSSEIKRSDCIKYLGAHLDENLSLRKHIVNKCRTAMFNLLCIKNIRHMLAMDAYHTIMLGLVILHLNYVNVIIAELPDLPITMLQ